MDCNHARLLLEVAHPIATELDARDTEQLAAHLASCPDCGALAENDRLADEQLAKVMRDVPVPDGFKFRLLNRLGRERDAWYRGWLVRAAGLAAALLLAVGLVYAMWGSKKPAPDVGAWHGEVEAQSMAGSAGRVEEVFAAKGVGMKAPSDFKYEFLHSFGMADFRGQQVPYLLFFFEGTPPAIAKVYVLSDRQFNLDDLRNYQEFPGSRQNVRVLRHPDHPRFAFIVIYTGRRENIEVFLKPQKPQG
jgi:hypothetical protein